MRGIFPLILKINALTQADLYEFTANLSYGQNGSNHDLRLTMLEDGGVFADSDNEGTNKFIFSGSGILKYQRLPDLWIEVGDLSMELSHWQIFSWPTGGYTPDDTLPPIFLPPNRESRRVYGLLPEPIFPTIGVDIFSKEMERSTPQDKKRRFKST